MKQNKTYTGKQARVDLPKRTKLQNKSHGGKSLVVAGSSGMWGAAILCAIASSRVGAGYTYIFDPSNDFPIRKHPDFLIEKHFSKLDRFNAIALGPGLKNSALIMKILKALKKKETLQVVIDAEALNTLARLKRGTKLLPHWILTPHEGELARLLKTSSQQIRKNRQLYIKMAQKQYGCIILLKGHKTLVADRTGIYVIQSGNSSLAKAGTGDVLTGMICGFLSQGLSPIVSSCLAAYVHGYTADQWIFSGHDHLSLMASDILVLLPKSLRRIRTTNSRSTHIR